ncbi:MAG: excinuclease ABC subunit UvrC, partial [Candidatus Omnitrophica bacterium]|nr:excinuclease ABC subunit UvrC [Candidatus Omnitrophota bacterium]
MERKRKVLKKLNSVPDIPGVYLMKDERGNVIYVGKATSLKKRIASYFYKKETDPKSHSLISNIQDFEFIPVASEAEALILENNLIKKYQPRYNVNLKDDKSYPFVKITKERFPSVQLVREPYDGVSLYFGPFTNVELVKNILRFIRRYYPVRNCKNNLEKRKVRLCSQYYIKRCAGPCEGRISEVDYRKLIDGIISFLKGDYQRFTKELKKQMDEAIKKLEFEKADEIKKRLFMLDEMRKKFPLRDEKALFTYGESNVLFGLKEILHLGNIPYHIEGYDVSNIQGDCATASKVSFKGGAPDKDNYRRYRIKFVEGIIDDCKMLQEVITRRFDTEEERKEIPDLILIDGGKAQLNTAIKALKKMEIDIPVISLAKKEEEIYIRDSKEPLRIKKDSPELHLLQAIRDEAHRFAVSYHRKLRRKKIR